MTHRTPRIILAVAAATLTILGGARKCLAQQTASYTPFEQKLLDGFTAMYEKGVAEKVYLHTDKPYYSAGETVYIKGYVVNALDHRPLSKSNFIYVQLIDSRDQAVQQFKIMRDSAGVFRSQIELPATVPAGRYTLRGFTKWMQNFGEEYFFGSQIEIGNTIDDAVNCKIDYRPQPDGSVRARVAMLDSKFAPIAKCSISYKVVSGGKTRERFATTDSEGCFEFDFTPQHGDLPQIEIQSQNEDYPYERTFDIPLFDKSFDVQFFPEGGALLAGQLQLVAFKAIGADGLGVDVNGSVIDENGEVITETASSHLGMGTLSMTAEKGKTYYTEFSTADTTLKFALPQVAESGCAVKLLRPSGRMAFQVLGTPDIDLSRLAAIIHCRGRLAYATEDVTRPVMISTDGFTDGIHHLSIIDKTSGDVLSQRLFFVNNGGWADSRISGGKDRYGRRERVSLDLEIRDSEGHPVSGDFSVAVTDRYKVRRDSSRQDILSALLLTSDLKGHIEQPGYYFTDRSALLAAHLDMVMLTQGWTRFDMQALLNKALPENEIAAEDYQSVSGTVIGFTGKELKDSKVVIMEPEYKLVRLGYHEEFNLGKTGKFNIRGVPLTEGKRLVVRAYDKRGWEKGLELRLDPEILPAPKGSVTPELFHKPAQTGPSEAYLQSSKEKYYNDGGMRVVDMEGVTVRARKVEQSRSRLYNITPTYTRTNEELTKYGGRDVYSALITFPGVTVNTDGSAVYIRGGNLPALVLLDDMEVDMSRDMLASISIDDVEFIDIIAGADAAMFGGRGDGGVVNIKLKEGVRPGKRALPSVDIIRNLGVRLPVEFYQPKYDVPEHLADKKPDLRTTIAWIPDVKPDENGIAHLEFYTADFPSAYDIIVEGITDSGQPCRSKHTIYRE